MGREAVIVSACRTAVGTMMGSLASFSAAQLGGHAAAAALQRAGIEPEQAEQLLLGCVLQAGAGQNVARQAAMKAGMPQEKTATTINMVCGSGLKAIILAAQSIICGDSDIIVAGGTESMSQAPHYLKALRKGSRLGDTTLMDGLLTDGLTDAFHNIHMGVTAENIAQSYGISRREQDQFAAASQRKALDAIKAGYFKEEIEPITFTDGKGKVTVIDEDEHPRPDTTMEKLSALRPAFRKEGTVTAGNASGINDGAAAVVLMSGEKAAELGLQPLARLVSWHEAGVDPALMGMGPVPALQGALRKAGLTIDHLDLAEVNEAFAAQSLAVIRELGLEPAKVNVNGGAIALGHPIGASGARILVTLLHELRRRRLKRGAAALCIGGGMGISLIIERIEERTA